MNAQAVAIEKLYHRPIMSSFHALFSTGGLLGAALGGLIASLGISPVAHFCLVALVVGIALLASFPNLLSEEQSILGDGAERAPLFQLPARGLVALGLIALCSMVGEGAMADWSAVYLKQTVETSEGLAAAGYAAFSITMAIGRFMGDGLSARFGSVNLVRNGALLPPECSACFSPTSFFCVDRLRLCRCRTLKHCSFGLQCGWPHGGGGRRYRGGMCHYHGLFRFPGRSAAYRIHGTAIGLEECIGDHRGCKCSYGAAGAEPHAKDLVSKPKPRCENRPQPASWKFAVPFLALVFVLGHGQAGPTTKHLPLFRRIGY